MALTDPKGDSGFAAFISYAHRDARWARWAHRALETYRLPRTLAKVQGRSRVGRIFLDRSELATSTSLSDRIEEALTRSVNLIVICSPSARASRWVNEEVRRFRAMGRGERIFCLIVDGDPAREDENGCFPPALLEAAPGEPWPEPLAADVRPGNDKPGAAKLKLIAGLLEVPFDALRRRDAARRQRVLAIVAGVSLSLVAVMGVITVLALRARAEAVRQRNTAEVTARFLQGIFDLADPTGTGGKEPTLRAAVDEAAAGALMSPELRHQPDVKISLLTILARVYTRLRLISEGRRVMNVAIALPTDDLRLRVRILSVDANLKSLEGDSRGLRRSLIEAFTILLAHPELQKYYLASLLTSRAQLAQADHDYAAALRDWREARNLSLKASPPDRDNALLAMVGEAITAVEADMPDRAAPLLRKVIAEREAMGQPLDPQVLMATNTLGSVEIKRGHPAEAERWFRKALALKLKVYGEQSLDVAATRNNLGRALVEQRRFAEAARVLEVARAGYVAQVGEGVDTMAKLEDSLGLARAGLGETAAARAAFAHGLAVARKHDMPKAAELLADRAELECRAGAAAAGLPMVAEARQALVRFELKEPWYKARLDAVEGGCMIAAGRSAEAKPLLADAMPVVVARWGKNSLFGRSVSDDARRAGVR